MTKRRVFTTWLRDQARRDDMIGDLARDMIGDAGWPRPTTERATIWYLHGRGACGGALEAVQRAWCEWRESHRESTFS